MNSKTEIKMATHKCIKFYFFSHYFTVHCSLNTVHWTLDTDNLCGLAVPREAPLDFAPGFLGFALAFDAGRFIILAALDFLHDSVPIALTLKTPECLLNGLVFTKLNADH